MKVFSKQKHLADNTPMSTGAVVPVQNSELQVLEAARILHIMRLAKAPHIVANKKREQRRDAAVKQQHERRTIHLNSTRDLSAETDKAQNKVQSFIQRFNHLQENCSTPFKECSRERFKSEQQQRILFIKELYDHMYQCEHIIPTGRQYVSNWLRKKGFSHDEIKTISKWRLEQRKRVYDIKHGNPKHRSKKTVPTCLTSLADERNRTQLITLYKDILKHAECAQQCQNSRYEKDIVKSRLNFISLLTTFLTKGEERADQLSESCYKAQLSEKFHDTLSSSDFELILKWRQGSVEAPRPNGENAESTSVAKYKPI